MSKKIFQVIMVAAFVAFAGFSAITVINTRKGIDSTVITSKIQTPESWSNIPTSSDAKTSLDVATDNSVVLYTASITNTKEDGSLYLTNFASYLDEAHGNHDGFLPLNNETAEYSYNPTDTNSWQTLNISAPKNGMDGFRLDNSLAIGPAGSNTDTIYIRFQIAPTADQDVVSNKVAVVVDDGYGYRSSATASTSVATNIVEADPYVVAADTPNANPHAIFDKLFGEGDSSSDGATTVAVNEDGTGESAFTQPLGAFSEVTDLKTIANVATSNTEVDGSFTSTASMILLAILAVFAIAFIGYIVVVKV